MIKKNWWLVFFVLFIGIFAWKVFFKGYLIGPFDFLVGFYDPYYEIKWPDPHLVSMALHYKNNLLSDVVSVVLPLKLLSITMWKHGQIPLWNPYILGGSPLLAGVQAAVLYPFNVFYFLFEPKLAYNIYILLQPILAFFFMFAYLRNLKRSKYAAYFGSLAFSFSTFFVVWLSWGTLGHAFLWLPLILFASNQYLKKMQSRFAFLFVFGLVSSFLAGHTQTSVMVFGAVFLYAVYLFFTQEKRNVLNLFILFCIAILLTCIQLVPSIEMYGQSVRDALARGDFYKDQTLLFTSYLQAIFPDFFGHPVTRNWWGKINYAESAIYFGATSLYFLIYFLGGIKKRFKSEHVYLLTIFAIGLLLSTQNPLSFLVYRLKLPLLSTSTFSRYSVLFIFAGATLAGYGFDYLLEDIKKKKFTLVFYTSLFFMLVLGLVWGATFLKLLTKVYLENIFIIKRNIILPTIVLLALIVSIIGSFILQRREIPKKINVLYSRILPFVIILLLSFELLRFATKYTPFVPSQFFYHPHKLVTELQTLTVTGRYLQYFPANVNSIYGIAGIEGKDPLYNLKLAELAGLSENGKTPKIIDRTGLSIASGKYKERLLDLMSVKYFVDKTDNFRNSWIDEHDKNNQLYDARFKEIWTDGVFKIYENMNVVERFKVFYKNEFIENKSKRLEKLASSNFDYQNTIVLEKNILKSDTNGQYTIMVKNETPQSQDFRVSTTKDGIFAITNIFYPGWKVYVDNREEEILRVNHAFQGVLLSSGEHTVEFVYNSDTIKMGVVLSLLGFISLILFLVKPLWKK